MAFENRFDEVQINQATLLRAQEKDHRLKTCTIETLRKNQENSLIEHYYLNELLSKDQISNAKDRFKNISRKVIENVFADLISLYPFVQVMNGPSSLVLLGDKFVPIIAKSERLIAFDISADISKDSLLIEVISGTLKKLIDQELDKGMIYCPYVPLATNPFFTLLDNTDKKMGLIMTRYGRIKA